MPDRFSGEGAAPGSPAVAEATVLMHGRRRVAACLLGRSELGAAAEVLRGDSCWRHPAAGEVR